MPLPIDRQATEVVQRALDLAARRRAAVVLAAEVPLAISILLGALLALGLAGTSLLHPLWLLLAGALAVAVAWARIRSRSAEAYAIAQAVDARLHLNDSLSTACFLLAGAAPLTPAGVFQIQSAARIAPEISPRQVFPFERSRSWYVVIGLFFALGTSLLTRYLQIGSLDLRPHLSIPAVLAELTPAVHETRKPSAVAGARRNAIPPLDQPGFSPDPDPTGRTGQQTQAGTNEPDSDSISALEQQLKSQQEAGASASLLDRMKEAMHSLDSELKQHLPGSDHAKAQAPTSQQNPQGDAAAQASSKASSGQQQSPTEKNSNGASQKQEPNADARAVENHNGTPLGPSDQAAQEKGSDAQSGAGRDEGQKTIQTAAQLEALGKLEQILGKRSASITGEMRLAKSAHDPQLETQYTNRVGNHSNSGGEIHRDQVPPQYRDYVRAYMDAMHAAANQAH